MTGRIIILILGLFALNVHAQQAPSGSNNKKPATNEQPSPDELFKHLASAESHQRAGDLENADGENKAVIAIALERLGNIAIEEGRYAEAARILTESISYSDTAPNRTRLSIAYLRQDLVDKALAEAKIAVSLDPKHPGARYILGNILYAKEDYKAALPELEKVFAEAPDFEIARALGLTYLNLKQIEAARLHFEKMRVSAGKEDADLHILFAKLYERTAYYADAERELKRALAIDPNKPKVSFYLGYLLLQNGGTERTADAGTAFERELKLGPNDFFSWFFAGVVASTENQHEKAITFFQKATEINPSNGESYLYLGQSQIETGDLANAEKNLRRAVELESTGGKNTQTRRTHFMLGRLLLRTGRAEEGQKELALAGKLQQESLDSSRDQLGRILKQASEPAETKIVGERPGGSVVEIKLGPERIEQLKKLKLGLVDTAAQAFYNLGVIAAQRQMWTKSLERFKSAAGWKPDFPGLDRNLGIIAFRSAQFETALVPLTSALKMNPEDQLVRQMLGTSLYFTKRYAETVEILKPVEGSLGGSPELAYFYGIALVQSNQTADATILFKRMAAATQQDPEALLYAAQGLMLVGDYGSAIKELTTIASAAPDLPKTYLFLGQSLIRTNRFDEAEKVLRRAIVIDPADASSKYQLAFTLIERKINLDEAVSLLEESIRLRPDFAEAHYQIGKLNLERNEVEKAIGHLEEAARADSGKDYIYYQLSIAYRKASRNADSDKALQTYQKLKSDNRKSEPRGTMGGPGNARK
ncbi:MAG: tetratricopeptide repeat protein [Pyrinomonadaceae bacterium]